MVQLPMKCTQLLGWIRSMDKYVNVKYSLSCFDSPDCWKVNRTVTHIKCICTLIHQIQLCEHTKRSFTWMDNNKQQSALSQHLFWKNWEGYVPMDYVIIKTWKWNPEKTSCRGENHEQVSGRRIRCNPVFPCTSLTVLQPQSCSSSGFLLSTLV